MKKIRKNEKITKKNMKNKNSKKKIQIECKKKIPPPPLKMSRDNGMKNSSFLRSF